METYQKKEFLVANVQNPANPKESKLCIVNSEDVLEFISDFASGCVVMFQNVEVYEARK